MASGFPPQACSSGLRFQWLQGLWGCLNHAQTAGPLAHHNPFPLRYFQTGKGATRRSKEAPVRNKTRPGQNTRLCSSVGKAILMASRTGLLLFFLNFLLFYLYFLSIFIFMLFFFCCIFFYIGLLFSFLLLLLLIIFVYFSFFVIFFWRRSFAL